MSDESPVDVWLATLVHSPAFQESLTTDIALMDKPTDRVRARLELLSYLMPKVKGVDPLTGDQKVSDIRITYVEAKPPKKPKGHEKTD